MQISDINNRLESLGAKTVHKDRFWREWVYARTPNHRQLTMPPKMAEQQAQMRGELEGLCKVVQEAAAADGGRRLVIELKDGQLIESVILPRGGVCVSTQVGCAVGCVFCMTGKSGLIRQLSDLEIVAQVIAARRFQKINKVVFMGMGEPSHNLPRVLSAIDFLATYAGIGYKNLVLSSIGDRRLFEALRTREIKPALALSLHTTDDEKRARLMPSAKLLPVQEIMDFAAEYAKIGAYPVQFQWTLLDGVNDGDEEIEALKHHWHNQYAVLNMIPVNTVEGSEFKRPSQEKMQAIAAKLKQAGILLKYRDSAAQEVDGGCGQLRARALSRN